MFESLAVPAEDGQEVIYNSLIQCELYVVSKTSALLGAGSSSRRFGIGPVAVVMSRTRVYTFD